MGKPHTPPGRYRTMKKVALATGLVAAVAHAFVSDPSWLKTTLLTIAIVCFAFGALLEIKTSKAEEAWRQSQPGYSDPMEGAPAIPTGENIGTVVGIVAFFALIYFWGEHKDTGLAGNDWWILALLPLAAGSLAYASWCKKKHYRAMDQWTAKKSVPNATRK